MESATQQQQQQQQRPPRTGVYVPRHRRVQNAGDDAQEPLSRSGTPHRQQESTQRPPTGRHNSSTSTFGSSSSQPKTWGSGGSTATATTTTTTTTGTGGSGGNDWRACHQGSNHRKNFGSSSPASTTTPSSSSTSLSSLSNREGPVQPQPTRPPRGRNFDATVLNVYDDDRRPRYSRSNSSQYRRSNHSSGNSSPRDRPSTPESRSSRGVGIDAASWRSAEPSTITSSSTLKPTRKASGSVTPEVCSRSSSNNPSLDNPESAAAAADRLAGQLQSLSVADQGASTSSKPATSSEGGGVEELEEWELAMQNSDEDAIPKLPTTGDDKKNKSGVNAKPSGTESPSSARTEVAAGDDAMGDDDYILELTHLAPSTKSFQVNDMFAPYANRSGGFRVKWIDDSRALVIFESATVAKQAYMATKSVTLATVTPYRGSDKDTIWRANRPSSTPSVRPAKTDSVARRLVHGALGIRERRTPEQIEQDRALRAAAREAREIARQERQRERQEIDAVFNQ